MTNIADLLSQLRKQVSHYRYDYRDEENSIHVNAIEISICLTEYLIERNRRIEESEKSWFNAGWYIIQLFEGTQYEDLLKNYLELCEILKKRDFSLTRK